MTHIGNYDRYTVLIVAVACFILVSCGEKNKEALVNQKIPISIKNNEVLELKINNLAGTHMVGIRCSPQTWEKLTNNSGEVSVRIKFTQKEPAKIVDVELGRKGTTCDSAKCNYLFAISGVGDVVVEMNFQRFQIEAPGEIIICKTPVQTEF